MADVFDRETRSFIMSRISGRNTKPEMLVRRFLHAQGYRYRVHVRNLPGRPDVVLPKYKTVVLVHGCFWHGHKRCGAAHIPKTNKKFWQQKLEGNRKRDFKHAQALRRAGWRVITVWECDLKKEWQQPLLRKLAA